MMRLFVMLMATVTASAQGGGPTLKGDGFRVAFSDADGAITSVTEGGESIWQSGEQGLWHIKFEDGSTISAADVAEGGFTISDAEGAHVMEWRMDEVTVQVTATAREDGVALTSEVTPKDKVVLDFALPGRLRFEPGTVERFICPANGNMSVGTAFNAKFFGMQPQENPAAWRQEISGPAGYEALFGGRLDQRENDDPATTLRVTEEGREWLGAGLVERVNTAQAVVNRPCTRGQADLTVVDSDNGPWISASHIGGEGYLWRIGGSIGDREARLPPEVIRSIIARLTTDAPEGRTKIGLIALNQGPSGGGWTAVTVDEWRRQLQHAARAGGKEFVALTTPSETIAAAEAGDYLAILNPYGEWAPAPVDGDVMDTVSAAGSYVRAGGSWFEVGGYPFFYALRPVRYMNHGSLYPAAFADFFHLDGAAGSSSVYRAQRLNPEPWAGAEDTSNIFVPGRLECGGDEEGGYCDRPFATYVQPGTTWRAPEVRMTVGNNVVEGLESYAAANGIERRLDQKMSPEMLDKFKNSVLVYYAGACAEKLANLDKLPVPTQVHYADYLKGGFDKEYPDHLPVREGFGTPEEFGEFYDRARALGHIMMPYTNPTWWCDHPKGPTFEREGTAPLLKQLSGEPYRERYSTNDGWTICFWHPAVQAINRETRRQFTEDFPVDILFQDQVGARSWRYDTNPASPTPYAYIDGLLSQAAEDSQVRPLSTEAGWDRVINYESQLCGLSWTIVPTEGGPSWRTPMRETYPADTWEIFPLAQILAHDKTAMLYHDLGQFVTNREVVSWTLGLGFCMSFRVSATALEKDPPREWLRYLDRLQKSVCGRHVGEPVTAFEHRQSAESPGVMRATYGDVEIVANLSPEPMSDGERRLPGFGYIAEAPGMIAANLLARGKKVRPEGVTYIAEMGDGAVDVWVYSPPTSKVYIELPDAIQGDVSITIDGGPAAKAEVVDGVLGFAIPRRAEDEVVTAPAELAGKAPLVWPGDRPAFGVIDLGEGVSPTWTQTQPSEWIDALGTMPLVKQLDVPLRVIRGGEELAAALEAGVTTWHTIVNPYGEIVPCVGGDWRAMLGAIREYVDNGGSWWEVGGYSLHTAAWREGGEWQTAALGPSGMGAMGLPVGGGEVDQPAEPLKVTPIGKAVLGDAVAGRIQTLESSVNRALPTTPEDPGHAALVTGLAQDFIGAYRLNGWGYFWRIGGMNPNPEAALPVVAAATDFMYTHAPLPAPGGNISYLWHARVERR